MRPGFSFLICQDSALLKEQLEKQIKDFPPDAGKWKRLVFWGDEEPGRAFWESLVQTGLFAEHRLIIVRQAELWDASTWQQLSSALAREHEKTWPFFCLESAWEKGKPKLPAHIQKMRCFTFAEKKGWIWRSQGLGQNFQRFAADQAKALGLKFQPADWTAFCAKAPQDAQGLINELRRVALLARDGRVSAEMFAESGAIQESDAFGLIKKITAGDLAGAYAEASADRDGGLLFFAIAMLAREFRTLWQLLAGVELKLHPAEATRKRNLARRLGFAGISAGLNDLAAAEWQVKSGRQSPGQTLEALCIKMCDVFGKR